MKGLVWNNFWTLQGKTSSHCPDTLRKIKAVIGSLLIFAIWSSATFFRQFSHISHAHCSCPPKNGRTIESEYFFFRKERGIFISFVYGFLKGRGEQLSGYCSYPLPKQKGHWRGRKKKEPENHRGEIFFLFLFNEFSFCFHRSRISKEEGEVLKLQGQGKNRYYKEKRHCLVHK